nr:MULTISPECIES: CoA pyrophosphatase [Sphingomonadales]
MPDLLTDKQFAGRDPRPAAVLIPVTDRAEPGAILTQRPLDMRSHPGQVAFPGGKLDAGEDAVEAALREAHEELALDPSLVRVIGATDRYHTGTGFDVTPVLGVIPPDLPLVPNPGEVESWFEVPLSVLFDRSNYTENSAMWKGAERRYYEMHWEGYRIWGVTAAIIFNLSRRLDITESFGG